MIAIFSSGCSSEADPDEQKAKRFDHENKVGLARRRVYHGKGQENARIVKQGFPRLTSMRAMFTYQEFSQLPTGFPSLPIRSSVLKLP